MQIQTRKEIDTKTIQVLNPKEVVFEGGRTLKLSKEEEKADRYYVYGAYGVSGIYISEAKAVEQAYEESGRVTDRRDAVSLSGETESPGIRSWRSRRQA